MTLLDRVWLDFTLRIRASGSRTLNCSESFPRRGLCGRGVVMVASRKKNATRGGFLSVASGSGVSVSSGPQQAVQPASCVGSERARLGEIRTLVRPSPARAVRSCDRASFRMRRSDLDLLRYKGKSVFSTAWFGTVGMGHASALPHSSADSGVEACSPMARGDWLS